MSRVVLVTGASGGIGSATALRFAEAGDWIAVHYHTNRVAAEKLLHTIEQIPGGRGAIFSADFRQPKEVCALCKQVAETLGEVEVLVNNAGFTDQRLFHDLTLSDWNDMMNVHLTTAFLACQAVLPPMIQKKRGKIINISSIYGISGGSCEVSYSAAKAGIIGLTKGLAKELGPSGIQVNCVAPGAIKSPMTATLSPETISLLCDETPLGRLGTPEEIAETIFFLASQQADFITGQVISPNGGIVM